jgi:hypothetical protein
VRLNLPNLTDDKMVAITILFHHHYPIIYKVHCIFDRAEHRSHSPNCSFAKKGKPQGKLTVEEFMKMEMESQQNRIVCK